MNIWCYLVGGVKLQKIELVKNRDNEKLDSRLALLWSCSHIDTVTVTRIWISRTWESYYILILLNICEVCTYKRYATTADISFTINGSSRFFDSVWVSHKLQRKLRVLFHNSVSSYSVKKHKRKFNYDKGI